jgi:23S rRNA (adenine2030-N6)-methyltransferase
MLAYRHAFHAGNHADVIKHVVLCAVLEHMNDKDKGWRYVDTHAGAGLYALRGKHASVKREYAQGVGRLLGRGGAPLAVAPYLDAVRAFNAGGALEHYPGSPVLARQLMRAPDELRLFELHPTDHRVLSARFRGDPRVQVSAADGFAALRSVLPPPTRRAVVLIDPPYELKADYARVVAALREALERFAEGIVIVWSPQLALLQAAELPRRLKATAATLARKGWLHARLNVARAGAQGYGLTGSHVIVANPPHTLAAALRQALPWLAQSLGQEGEVTHAVEHCAP